MKRIVMVFGFACLVCGFVKAQEQKQVAERQALEWRLANEAKMQEAGVMFGQVVKGIDVVAAIEKAGTQSGKPTEKVIIESVTITEAD